MMTYIQLSLLGIPAKVVLGDTLSLKFQQVLYTPFYFLSGIEERLEQQKEFNNLELSSKVFNQQLTLFNF